MLYNYFQQIKGLILKKKRRSDFRIQKKVIAMVNVEIKHGIKEVLVF